MTTTPNGLPNGVRKSPGRNGRRRDRVRAAAAAEVTRPGYEIVTKAMQRLSAIAAAGSDRAAETLYVDLLDAATKSSEILDATFLAAQALRDLGTLTAAEATWMFRALFQTREDRLLREHRLANWRHVEAAFYDVRGEDRLARMVIGNRRAFDELCTEGLFTLVEDKRAFDLRIAAAPNAATVAEFRRRLAQAGSDGKRRVTAYVTVGCELMQHRDVHSAVVAVQESRAAGEFPRVHADLLISELLAPVISGMLETDREWRQLSREMRDCLIAYGIDPSDARHAEPAEYKILKVCRNRRERFIKAYCYRLYGEHPMANALRRLAMPRKATPSAARRAA